MYENKPYSQINAANETPERQRFIGLQFKRPYLSVPPGNDPTHSRRLHWKLGSPAPQLNLVLHTPKSSTPCRPSQIQSTGGSRCITAWTCSSSAAFFFACSRARSYTFRLRKKNKK